MLKQKKALTLCTLIGIIQMTASASIDQPSSPSPSSGLFAADLLAQLAKNKANENIVFSPLSIQTALAMVYLGAEGKTAEELQNSLHLPSTDRDQVGEYFAKLLNKNTGGAKLSIANRMFVHSDFQLQAGFNKRAEKYFNSGVEALNFGDLPSEAIKTINTWVENKTNNKIKNLMKPGSVDSYTIAIIVNAIYFKGEWEHPFSHHLTRKIPFWVSQNQSIDVDTMYASKKNLKYGEFPELDATAVELPYKDSDLSMMLILPFQRDGLAELERKLVSISINDLSSKMTNDEKVEVQMPKFKIDFSTKLSDVLQEMGICSLFAKANLPGIFESAAYVKVTNVQHKAFIDVNEAGCEATAATFYEVSSRMLDFNIKYFIVDRPFFFAIKDSNSVYFAGHVAKF